MEPSPVSGETRKYRTRWPSEPKIFLCQLKPALVNKMGSFHEGVVLEQQMKKYAVRNTVLQLSYNRLCAYREIMKSGVLFRPL